MSRLTVIWSTVASACLKVALLHRLVGWSKHAAWAIPAIAFPGSLFWVVLPAGIASSTLFAQEHKAAPGENVLPDVSRDSSLRVVYPVVMPPYTFEDDKGEAQGLSVELLRLWSEKTGTPIQFKSAAWGEGIRMMREGKADIHASLYLSEEREEYLTYAAIVASSQGMVFYHKSIININAPGDLKAFRLGVVQNSYHEQYIKQHVPEALLVSYPEFPDMLLAAQKGDIRVFVEDAGTTLYRLRERGLTDEFRCDPDQVLYRNNFWIAVHKGNTKLAKALKEGMELITPEERVTLERKWLPGSLIRTPGTLFIAMSNDSAPYSFVNAEGMPAGFFVDIWKLWAEKTGKKVEFLPSDWDDALNKVRLGSADIHSGLFRSETSAQWFDFSIPICESRSSLFYLHRQNKRYAERGGDLAGRNIGVLQGTYHEQYLRREHPDVNVIPFSSREKMLRAVVSGDTSACLAEDESTSALLNRLGLSGMFDAEPLMPFAQTIHAGVPKGNAQLLSLVNDGLKAIAPSELASIEQHWLMGSEEDRYRSLVKWFLAVAGTALALICIFVLWNRSLSRMVKARTAILAESEERFRSTFEQAAVGIAHLSPAGRFLRINRRFCDILGYSREEMLQRTFQDITYPDDLGPDLERVNQTLSGERDTYSMEKRYIRKDGVPVWVNLTVALVRNESGQPHWFVSVVQDISDRKRAEEILLQHKFRLASAVDVADLGFYEVADGERIVFVDSRAQALTGVPGGLDQGNLALQFWAEHLHPEDSPRILDEHRKLNAGALDRVTVEYRYRNPQRGLIWIHHLTHVLNRDAAGRATRTIGVLRDITERKQAELERQRNQAEIAHLSRVAMLGELSGSLAHELNQPLSAILSNAQAALNLLALDPIDLHEVRDIIADIVADDTRAAEVISRLRLLLKKGETQHQLLKVNEIVREVLKLVGSDLTNQGVTTQTLLARNLPLVLGDRVQLQQVLLNLVMNACDAMAGVEREARQLTIGTDLAEDGAVHISVADGGTGIVPEMLEQIFEPFHTTKTHGLGLGLAVCRTIVTAHDGKLWATNNPERGATLHFTLPADKGQGKAPFCQSAVA
ncbi:MAG: histidine kinase [Acidobacteria bacterium]|nr:histidine kinase [Acidobacteriota bacterium]